MHDERVRGRNVEAGFDDRGGEKHVELAVVERGHDVFEDARRHLAVRHRNPHFRNVAIEERFGLAQILDAWADIERLPAAIALAQERLAHCDRIEWRDESAHREPIDRRRGDDRHFTDA
jgi:hypothetical protein